MNTPLINLRFKILKHLEFHFATPKRGQAIAKEMIEEAQIIESYLLLPCINSCTKPCHCTMKKCDDKFGLEKAVTLNEFLRSRDPS